MDQVTRAHAPAVTTDRKAKSGVARIRGSDDVPELLTFTIDYWLGVDECTAVGYSVVESLPIAVGLVHYAPITAVGVREWRVGKMIEPRPGVPRFNHREPPSPDELRKQWDRLVDQGASPPTLSASAVLRAEATVSRPQLARSDYETPDEFYAEVARHYRAFESTTGKPTSSIARIAEVPRNTAAQWVYQARKRGHLPSANDKVKGE